MQAVGGEEQQVSMNGVLQVLMPELMTGHLVSAPAGQLGPLLATPRVPGPDCYP